MKIQFTIESESQDEIEFVEDVARVRDQGLEAGLSQREVARVLIFVAQGLLSESFERHDVSHSEEDVYECPVCGGDIGSVEVTGIGEDPVVEPCGCSVQFEDLPQDKIDEMLDR